MVIYHNMLETMLDEFILEGISSKVVLINQNSEEYEKYTADLNTNNDKNDLYHLLGIAEMKNTDLINGCIYTNVNEVR